MLKNKLEGLLLLYTVIFAGKGNALKGAATHSITVYSILTLSIMTLGLITAFDTEKKHFLCHLQMGRISYSLALCYDARDKHFSLFGPFANYEENEVL